ncbi:MAG TPA: SIMPL domain-containing protein [Bryobacteraceae bacterium]|nr:SIMPL domain-containing protein [Bryobacteraceae bacterium]
MRKLFPIFLLAAVPAVGQLQTDTITITAVRQVSLQPDQVVFSVQVSTPETAALDDALAAVSGAGVTAADLTGVFTYNPNMLRWSFTLAVPFSQAGATIKTLTQIAQQSNGAVSVSSQGTQVSQALQSQPCSQASLISDAQAQAQNLAAAAGFSVGPVLAVSDGSGSAGQSPAAVVRYAFVGIVSTVSAFLELSSYVAPTPPITCTAVVKFQLLRYH